MYVVITLLFAVISFTFVNFLSACHIGCLNVIINIFIQTFGNVHRKSNEHKHIAKSRIGTNSNTPKVTTVLHGGTTVSSTTRGSKQKFNLFYFNLTESKFFT